MKKSLALLSMTIGMALLSGCAPIAMSVMNSSVDEEKIIVKTAAYFGVDRKKIAVSAIDKGTLATGYKVRYDGKLYNCGIYWDEVTCKQPGM